MQKLKTVDADTLLTTPMEKTVFIVDGLIPQGVTLLCGASKVGKSWLMLYLGLQVAQGLPVWGSATSACDVLYLCLEDTFARIQNRLYRLTDSAPENLRFAVMSGRLGSGLEQQIADYLKEYPNTRLIMIDTLQKIRDPQSSNNRIGIYGSDYDDIGSIKRIADSAGIAIILVHHLRKQQDSSDPFNQVSGTVGMTGAADTTLVLKKDERMAQTAVLFAAGRDIEFQQMTLRFENCIWHLTERKDCSQLQQEQIPPFLYRTAELVKTRGAWEGTATELLSETKESEVSPNAVRKLLGHFYYEVLQPNGICYRTKRTGHARLICLSLDDTDDKNDGIRDISPVSSPSS